MDRLDQQLQLLTKIFSMSKLKRKRGYKKNGFFNNNKIGPTLRVVGVEGGDAHDEEGEDEEDEDEAPEGVDDGGGDGDGDGAGVVLPRALHHPPHPGPGGELAMEGPHQVWAASRLDPVAPGHGAVADLLVYSLLPLFPFPIQGAASAATCLALTPHPSPLTH